MAEFSQRQKYDFKRDLEALRNKRGMHTELISLYVPPDRQIHDVQAQLRDEYSQAGNIKSKQTQKNVQAALESIQNRLKGLKQPPENGLAIFVGAVVTGNNQQDLQAYVFEPPQPVRSMLYRCDSRFFLEPLEDMLEEKEVYGLLLIDRRECTVGILRGKSIQQLFYDTSMVPGKHGRGGQSQRRFERLTEEAADAWFKKMAEKASDIFRQEKGIIGILVGGPGPSKKYFVDGEFLHHEVQKLIIDTFDTGYTDEFGLNEMVENAAQTISEVSIIKEKKLFQRLQQQIMKEDAGQATYGEGQVRYALQMGAVDTLLLSEGLRKERAKIACPNCGWEKGHLTVGRDDVEEAAGDEKCPECQSYLDVAEHEDLIDELSQMAEDTGAHVELISTESEEGSTLLRAFGGVAALLRYRLPEKKIA